VFVILFIVHVKKFALAIIVNIWCVQMIGVTKFIIVTFFGVMGQSNWHVTKKKKSKNLGRHLI